MKVKSPKGTNARKHMLNESMNQGLSSPPTSGLRGVSAVKTAEADPIKEADEALDQVANISNYLQQ